MVSRRPFYSCIKTAIILVTTINNIVITLFGAITSSIVIVDVDLTSSRDVCEPDCSRSSQFTYLPHT